MSGAGDPRARAAARLAALSRWRPAEFAFWAAAVAALFLFPERSLLLSEIFITGLFALSLDLILGYAGVLSLGHAAFFGLGAYVAGIAGSFFASLLLGVADVAGKYYVPAFGAFAIYTVMIAVLIWRPQGLFGRVAAR